MSTVMASDKSEVQNLDDLVPIEPHFIEVGDEISFPILQRANGSDEYVLLVNKDQKFTDRIRLSIQNAADSKIFTKRRHLWKFERYVEGRMKQVLSNDSVPLESRSIFLYEEVSRVMNDLFEGNIQEDSLGKAAQFASHMSDFIGSNPGALRTMMSITVKDYYLFTHSIHVCIYGLGLFLRTTNPEFAIHVAQDVTLGLLLHDVGNTRIDKAILNKVGRLTPTELAVVKHHPELSCEILKQNNLEAPAILDIALSHHERMNGKGYPRGLKGDQLSNLAGIVGIVDSFDSMTTDRPHKKALSLYDALHQLKSENEKFNLFDRDLFEAFVQMMAE